MRNEKKAAPGARTRQRRLVREVRSDAAKGKALVGSLHGISINILGLLLPKFQRYREPLEHFPSSAGQATIARPAEKVHLQLTLWIIDSSMTLKLQYRFKRSNLDYRQEHTLYELVLVLGT